MYASRDNLFEVYTENATFAQLVKFIIDSVCDLASAVNGRRHVQVGSCGQSTSDKKNDLLIGITRFCGPDMEVIAAGHCEFGNPYLNEDMNWDSYPEDGKLEVFPSVHGEKDISYSYDSN